jgi:DNA-binding response OmpR family regulator
MMGRSSELAATPFPLEGMRVLVVEDDFFIGLNLCATLSDAGAVVIGPSQTVASALDLADDQTLSAAVLDIRLGQDTVEPVARRLAELGTPFLFYTGQTKTDPVRTAWPDCRIVSKPGLPTALIAAVASLLKTRSRAGTVNRAS